MSEQQREPTEEEMQAAIEEQIRKLKVQDVLLQTVVTLVNLTGRRLTQEGERDLEQAKLGIEGVRALLPLCPEDQAAPIKDALSQLQIIFAREAQAPAPAEEPKPEPKRESRIWTPPGT
jgi:hypothetical protein